MQTKKIAEERIEILFEQAEERFDEDPELAHRYVEIARRIGERAETPVPKEFKRSFCSSCGSFWRIGSNCTVDINEEEGVVKYSCGNCGDVERYAY